MALWFHLHISSSFKAAEAERLLQMNLNAKRSVDGFLTTPEALITAREASPGPGTEVFEEAFHFTANLSILFRYLHNDRYEEFARTMLRGAMLLLAHGQDAVLLFNGEIIVLQRLGGRLIFNTDYKIWDDEALLEQEVHIPYERRSLPSPLL